MSIATLTSKAQLTLPKEIREHLGVHRGDRLEFRKGPSGRVWVEAATLDLATHGVFSAPRSGRGARKNSTRRFAGVLPANHQLGAPCELVD